MTAQMADCNFDDPRIDEGISLFNAGEFFACHDVLEDFWGELTCPEKPLFQGLIQAAVALHHFEEGNPGGARRMVGSCSRLSQSLCADLRRNRRCTIAHRSSDLFQELLEEHARIRFICSLIRSKVPKIYRAAR